jgi:orotate phosphoribosyltransferase
MNTETHIAQLLLKEKAVFLRPEDPFTWTSGIKSPIYCDNRILISSPETRTHVIKAFCDKIKSYPADYIAGTATAGIPWAAWIADHLNLPLVYVRSSSKEHGRQNAIEGRIPEGSRAILIEDLISTGKSSVAAAQRLQEQKVQVPVVLSIFSYNLPVAQRAFLEAQLNYDSLSTFEVLAQVAYDQKMLNAESLNQVLEWRKSVTL